MLLTRSRSPAIQLGKEAQGPQRANLFVFHIPNNMMTKELYQVRGALARPGRRVPGAPRERERVGTRVRVRARARR